MRTRRAVRRGSVEAGAEDDGVEDGAIEGTGVSDDGVEREGEEDAAAVGIRSEVADVACSWTSLAQRIRTP
jgi:hypothetical protein